MAAMGGAEITSGKSDGRGGKVSLETGRPLTRCDVQNSNKDDSVDIQTIGL